MLAGLETRERLAPVQNPQNHQSRQDHQNHQNQTVAVCDWIWGV